MTPHQGDLFASVEAGHAAMRATAERADRQVADWQGQAMRAATLALSAMPSAFTFEQLRTVAEQAVEAPPDLRAWGAVCQRLVRDGVLVATGGYAPRVSGHGTPTKLYRRRG